MANNKKPIEARDWAIIALFLLVIVTNFWWWSINKVRDGVEQDIQIMNSRQGLIDLKLKQCIDENIKPCNISIDFQE